MSIDELKFINTFAPWFSAIGSISAVITSLYFSYTNRKISLEVSASVFQFAENDSSEDYVFIQITNTGYRTVMLRNFSWEIGLFKKKIIGIGFNNIDGSKSTPFPCKLEEGQMAQIAIKIHRDTGNYLEEFYNDFLKKYPKFIIKTLSIVVYPTIGKEFKSRVHKTLIDELNFYKKRKK